jgi:hypothetical protein
VKHWLADRLRRWADRIDHAGAPKRLSAWTFTFTFTFEKHIGVVFRQDGRGCPLWYLGDADYDRAHDEADNPPLRVDWKALAEGRPPFLIPPKATVLFPGPGSP